MDHTKELILQAHKGDTYARDTLVLNNTGLVYSVARRFLGRGYDLEDLFQIGVIGLIKAIDKFQWEYDVKLSTYAVPMISGEIRRFLRDDGLVKISRSIKENAIKIKRAQDEYRKMYAQEATVEEIKKNTGLTEEDIVMALEADREVESINKSVFQKDGSEICLCDQLASRDNEKDRLLDRMLLEKLLGELKPEERDIIELRYYKNLTQTQVAGILGTSQVQISRQEKRILMKMKNFCI